MDINEFKSKMADTKTSTNIDRDFMESTVKGALRPLPDFANKNGTLNLIIVMEEFAELMERISERGLYMPDDCDGDAFLEEIADTYICFEFIKTICHIKDEEIQNGDTSLYDCQPKSIAKICHIMSKMTQWVSKYIRATKTVSYTEIANELASAYRELNLIEAEYGFTKEEIAKAINVKLMRQAGRNDKTSW